MLRSARTGSVTRATEGRSGAALFQVLLEGFIQDLGDLPAVVHRVVLRSFVQRRIQGERCVLAPWSLSRWLFPLCHGHHANTKGGAVQWFLVDAQQHEW